MVEVRPWGSYEILCESDNYKVKRIIVNPSCQLSYQYHCKRSEHWFIVQGRGIVTIDNIPKHVEPGESVEIAIYSKHRVKAIGNTALVFIEVQRGSYFGEDDIVRIEDDYGRINGKKS